MTHDLWTGPEPAHGRVSGLGHACKNWSTTSSPRACQIEDKPIVRRAISTAPVVKPIRVNAPNSVFALGNAFDQILIACAGRGCARRPENFPPLANLLTAARQIRN